MVNVWYTGHMLNQIIDANVNRIGEGLRVIEEYVRFVWSDEGITQRITCIRKKIAHSFPQCCELLHSRSTATDVRAKEVPRKRGSLFDLLAANFKRVQEALRVLEEYAASDVCNACRYDMYDIEQTVLLAVKKPEIRRGIYLISDSVDVLQQGMAWGCAMVQLRDKDASKSEVLDRAYQVAEVAQSLDVPFIINDYIDIAVLVKADGVHTGQDDMSIQHQRRLIGDHCLIGRTTHTLEQGKQAMHEGADYVSVGPIWETPSKPGRSGIGFDYLQIIQQELTVPYVAIGGINHENIHDVMRYSPFMVGVIRSYQHIPEWQKKFF